MLGEFSFSSARSGRRQEDSILCEYRRLNLQQESFHFSIDPVAYAPLPRFLPARFAREYSHCIFLENASFYEMFTFAIFEHLFRAPSHAKAARIARLKDLVCSNGFLSFANFTKGLILKGLKAMAENAEAARFPVAEVLMGSEKMPAFCECWKEMLFYFRSKHQEVGDINSSMIEVFTQFFEVDLRFYSRKGKEWLEEVIRGTPATPPTTTPTPNPQPPSPTTPPAPPEQLSVLLISSAYEEEEHFSKEQSISSISSIYGNWTYYVLLPAVPEPAVELPLTKTPLSSFRANRRATITLDYPELFAIDEEKSQIKSKINGLECEAVVDNARRAVSRGFELVERMRDFADRLAQ